MASSPQTQVLKADDQGIAAAARLILSGHPVAVPTETVYGLAADATDGAAVAHVYQAKGRPSFNPLIVHVRDFAEAESIGIFNEYARDLANQFWPGPLTLVVPLVQVSAIASLVTAGLPTVAIRVPAHPVMRALLAACGRPLAAPSANASGSISPTLADHVVKSLAGRIPLVLDGGPTARGLESTIVDTIDRMILRKGPITREELHMSVTDQPDPDRLRLVKAPGQLTSHYAPSKPLRLDATHAGPDEYLIGFGPIRGDLSLSQTGDLAEAAARLFDLLHRADASDKPRIAVAPVPEDGLGAAINDRLTRAAA